MKDTRATVATRRRILLIEDNSDIALALYLALEVSGHEVRIAGDGVSGIELASRFQPDVVVSDIGLPGMDGYSLAQAFRTDQRLRETFLVALTAYARSEDVRRAAIAGYDRHLANPVAIDELERVINGGHRHAD